MGLSTDNRQKNVYVCQMAKENGFESEIFRSYCLWRPWKPLLWKVGMNRSGPGSVAFWRNVSIILYTMFYPEKGCCFSNARR